MTPLRKPIHRITQATLDGSFGPDRNRRLVVTLIPGHDGQPDLIELRPLGTRRPERGAALDIYRFLIRSRANADHLAKARARKERKAARLAALRQARAEKRLTQNI